MKINRLPRLDRDEALARMATRAGGVTEAARELIEALTDDFSLDELLREYPDLLARLEATEAEMVDLGIPRSQGILARLHEASANSETDTASCESPARIHWHSGDLHLAAFSSIEDDDYDCFIVDGDLIVDGCLEITPFMDYGGFIVLGSLRAETMICTGALVVRGDVHLRHAYLNAGNDCAMVVGGNLTTISLVEEGEFVHVQGDLEARCVATFHNVVQVDGKERCARRIENAGYAASTRQVFDPDLLEAFEGEDDDGAPVEAWHTGDAYLDRLRQGGSPLQDGD